MSDVLRNAVTDTGVVSRFFHDELYLFNDFPDHVFGFHQWTTTVYKEIVHPKESVRLALPLGVNSARLLVQCGEFVIFLVSHFLPV